MPMKRDRERAKADKKAAKQEKLTEATEKRREAQDAEGWEGENNPLPEELEAAHLWSWRAAIVAPVGSGVFHGVVGGWNTASTGEEATRLALAAIHVLYPPDRGTEILDMAVEQIPDDKVLQVADRLRGASDRV